MSRSLPLRAYLALDRAREPEAADAAEWPARPAGPLVWAHAAEPRFLEPIRALAGLLRHEGHRFALLVTGPAKPEAMFGSHSFTASLPAGSPRSVDGFLGHWAPDVLVWCGGNLAPRLIDRTRDTALARLLVEPAPESPLAGGGPLLPGVTRAILSLFDPVLTSDRGAAGRLVRSGVPEARLIVGPKVEAMPQVLPVIESDRKEMAEILGTRPVWLAVAPDPAEVEAILGAHRAARRRSHRLLLILASDEPDRLAPMVEASGFAFRNRLTGGEPDEQTDVYLADTTELGLWYRLAPISFMGGTFAGGPVRDPFEAAALGSASMHGPRIADHAEHFARLRRAGACRSLAGPEDLDDAVEALLSADKAAALAHAAWDTISEGAETLDRLASLIGAALNRLKPQSP